MHRYASFDNSHQNLTEAIRFAFGVDMTRGTKIALLPYQEESLGDLSPKVRANVDKEFRKANYSRSVHGLITGRTKGVHTNFVAFMLIAGAIAFKKKSDGIEEKSDGIEEDYGVAKISDLVVSRAHVYGCLPERLATMPNPAQLALSQWYANWIGQKRDQDSFSKLLEAFPSENREDFLSPLYRGVEKSADFWRTDAREAYRNNRNERVDGLGMTAKRARERIVAVVNH